MEAYRHQVGGHSQLMKPQDSSKVYKPFTESEFRFYEKLASLGSTTTDSGPLHVLKQFVPRYFGVTEVQTTSLPPTHFASLQSLSFNKAAAASRRALANRSRHLPPSNGADATAAMESVSSSETRSEGSPTLAKSQSRPCQSLNILASPKRIDSRHKRSERKDINPSVSSAVMTHTENENIHGPCHHGLPSVSSSVLKYIVLEDLVYQYKKPCVMDLKMGKRQRKIGASSEKEQRQLDKSLKTTSHAVGFRLCGMQFYDKKNDISCYRDKYWGRKLTKDTLRESICQWFWAGGSCYHELLLPLLSSLKILQSCISKLRHYRFWSSSLLWVFDGGSTDANTRLGSLDVRMIDFANTIVLKDNQGPDDEYLFGLGNLIAILESLVPDSSSLKESSSSINTSRNSLLTRSLCPFSKPLLSRPSSAQLVSERETDDSSDLPPPEEPQGDNDNKESTRTLKPSLLTPREENPRFI